MLNQIKKSLEKEYYKVALNTEQLNGQVFEQLMVTIIFQDHPQIPKLDLYLMFLPDVEKELDGVSLLQYYMGFTTGVNTESDIAKLKNIANELNKTLPIGLFGFNEFDNSIFIKYNQTLLDKYDQATEKIILTIVSALTFQISSNFDQFVSN
jgi:hypothetical protein